MVTEDANTDRHHASEVITALEAHGLIAHQPFDLDVVWVNLADGSTLHIGNDDDNLSLRPNAGYSIYRELDAEGVGGPDNDGDIFGGPDVSFDDMIAAVVAEARRAENSDTS